MARVSLLSLLVLLAGVAAIESVRAAVPQKVLPGQLLVEISSAKGGKFSNLTRRWREKHGPAAIPALLDLAVNSRLPEKTRSIALLSATRLAAGSNQPRLQSILRRLSQDSQWLVRLSAVKSLPLTAGDTPKVARPVIDLLSLRLDDVALVVRSEAAGALLSLSRQFPEANSPAVQRRLAAALHDSRNYSGNQPLWVPEKALAALVNFGAQGELPSIGKLQRRFKNSDWATKLDSAARRLESQRSMSNLSRAQPSG